MDNLKSKAKQKISNKSESHVADAANKLLQEGKKFAYELYEDNALKVNHAQENVKEYSEELKHKVQTNPLTAVLVAGGIGFLLAALLRK
jgi:ElaB/YqjD/DUF883 family membrane-anchored ribosome-binding protein